MTYSIGQTEYDHELKIGSTVYRLSLAKGDDGRAMYSVVPKIPQYRDPLRYIQDNWIDGHGQHTMTGRNSMWFEGQSIDTTQDGRVILGPLITEILESDATNLDGNPVGFQWFDATGEFLCWTAAKIYRYNVGADNEWTLATTSVAGVLDLTEFNGIMYAARGATGAYMYSTDGDTWKVTDLADSTAYQFLAAPNPSGTSDNLWKFKVKNEVSRTTDGRDAGDGGVAWETSTYVGDTSQSIVKMFLLNNKLFVGREDNLYEIDGNGGVHPYRDDLVVNQSSNNYKYMAEWQTSVYHSEAKGMAEITAYNSYEVMGPLHDIDDIGKVGTIVGMSADTTHLYVAVDEGTNTHIYKGREILGQDGKLVWQWCPWVFLGVNVSTTIKVCQHSATDIRLWFGYGAKTAYVVITPNPTSDTSARFAPTGFLTMSYDLGTNPNWNMLFQSVVTETKGCNATGEDVVIKYRKDTETAYTACTGDIITNGTVETNLSSALNCKRMQFQLNLSSNTNTATPEVLYFEAKGIEKPEVVRTHEVVYRVASGGMYGVDTETLRTTMRTAQTSTTLIKLADMRYGDSTDNTSYVWVTMEAGYPEEVEIAHEKNQQPEIGLKCRMREVSYTIA